MICILLDSTTLSLSFRLLWDSKFTPGAFELILPLEDNNISSLMRKKIFICSRPTLCESKYPSHHLIASKSYAWQSLDVSSLVSKDVAKYKDAEGSPLKFKLTFHLSSSKVSEYYLRNATNRPFLLVHPYISGITLPQTKRKRSADSSQVLRKLNRESKKGRDSFLKESITYEVQLRKKDIMKQNHVVYGCELRRLNVSFEDLGWAEHIVYPRYVEANYCIGNCQHPPNERVEMKYTAHAFIRSSFMRRKFKENSSAVFPHGLKPCCVPIRLAPMSLLYQINNTVYKADLNEIKVEKCACL